MLRGSRKPCSHWDGEECLCTCYEAHTNHLLINWDGWRDLWLCRVFVYMLRGSHKPLVLTLRWLKRTLARVFLKLVGQRIDSMTTTRWSLEFTMRYLWRYTARMKRVWPTKIRFTENQVYKKLRPHYSELQMDEKVQFLQRESLHFAIHCTFPSFLSHPFYLLIKNGSDSNNSLEVDVLKKTTKNEV